MLVAGRHFFDDAEPEALGWKTLAVNLSDLAAMGAEPRAFTLALALPSIDEPWLDAFARGLFDCADAHRCELVGGDTTRGPLTLSVTVLGDVDAARALRRDAALVGDDVWVSGTLGAARLALRRERERRDGARPSSDDDRDDDGRAALDRPTPRVALGVALVGVAHAAIDVSDGLAQDLGHVLDASRVGAEIELDRLPLDAQVRALGADEGRRLAIAGGDDYELCFTAPPSARAAVDAVARAADTPATRVGRIVAARGLRLVDGDGVDRTASFELGGFDHFESR